MSEPAVEISNLVKEFRTSIRRQPLRAVDDVSLKIDPGQVYGLIGPNGSGKSTTMKSLLGLLAPTAGSCAIFGRDSLKVDSRRDVGFLPENPYFYKHLTGAETIGFYGSILNYQDYLESVPSIRYLQLYWFVDTGKKSVINHIPLFHQHTPVITATMCHKHLK